MLYEVWAPHTTRVTLHTDNGTHPMQRTPTRPGWWHREAPGTENTPYSFALDDGPPLPDPRARRLPDGPDGPAAVIDPARWEWRHPWPGRDLPGAVLYELHTGTFTREGTFDAATRHLPHLATLGITHVELMPVCPFPGRHGWGYDGVAPWAVHEPYGGPDGLRRFVDAAHGHGLGVVLDVVHNHLGPSGNHLPAFGPYFTDRHQTPWGAAVNLDGPESAEVRSYFIDSALAWLRDYRLDGLRLDAVHALVDDGPRHFLADLSEAVDNLAERLGRPLFLIAESDRNDPATITPRASGGLGLHAQWNDDFHHALHTALTGESQGYYADFAADPAFALTKTLRGGFFHDGTHSSFRGRPHGRPLDPAGTPAHRLLGYAQTHDQIGNRALGDRLAARLSPGLLACAAALVLCAPFTPMLFMGEEWGARTPWQYFTDHTDPELAEAVRRGRRREFAAHGWPAEEIPDPQDPATRLRSCLDWDEPARAPHAELLAWHRRLTALRHTEPSLTAPDWTGTDPAVTPNRCVTFRRGPLLVAANLGRTPAALPVPPATRVLAAWRPLTAPDGNGPPHLPPESAAVLRVSG
ncbi:MULTISPECIES: malto-oligosyltrehalose trehalohydrolase [Streptomyces]|uniref:malto-oligosyltrehalose trehalohydrolase n=1 Tax=Streptomyces TaxID=1883 RepID=UPI00163CC6CA|nr:MULTISPECIES: malto-oligosyltrehalose trehalohydrolase [Streptomyces]MBC2877511.1 malto-oligosyltrehalose trehalohydrolase [Streptomyces sp. TYQ1024]UBI36246.1 malto-oligosyltrehalose trehalohydrolase [Streptomyces mobaraensis]UKW28840.1 malto-oligosyltrehalose trehalohydrolase [Streptomyces sp. TYQ1024]